MESSSGENKPSLVVGEEIESTFLTHKIGIAQTFIRPTDKGTAGEGLPRIDGFSSCSESGEIIALHVLLRV